MHRGDYVSENIINMQEHAFSFVNPSWWWVLILSGDGIVILISCTENVTFLCMLRPCNQVI